MAAYIPPALTTLRDIPISSSHDALLALPPRNSTDAPIALSHAALRHRVALYATSLSITIPPTSVVAIVMPNSAEFIVSFLAVTSAALVAAPLNPAYTVDEFSFYLQDANVAAVIVSDALPQNAAIRSAAASRNLPIMSFPLDLLGDKADDTSTYPSASPTGDNIALFLHTSGTTSRPKGVPLTHTNLITSISNIAATYELTSADRTLLVMPLFHVHGLMAATLATLASGGCIVIPPGGKFSATAFWPSAITGRITWYTAVPTMHQILLARADDEYPKDNAPKLRFIRSCSASLAPSVLERVEQKFNAPVLEAYAMTEASHQMTSNPLPKYGRRKPGSVGKAQRVDVAILNDKNEVIGQSVVGEVCIRGGNVTSGYNNNAEANESAFAGGWFHTGDQGWLDKEGYLTLTGRIKELVNRGGEKISPLEVDAALLAHTAVKEAVSFAVPDEKYGEEVNAAVILKEGSVVSEEDLTTFAKGRLASFKVPKRFFICEDLPRTATGKIQRRIVSKHFLDKLAEMA